jgi:hypothetical protein
MTVLSGVYRAFHYGCSLPNFQTLRIEKAEGQGISNRFSDTTVTFHLGVSNSSEEDTKNVK